MHLHRLQKALEDVKAALKGSRDASLRQIKGYSSLEPLETMEDFAAVATEISRQIEDKQRALKVSGEQEQRRIQGLTELLQRIGVCSDAFDEEDKKAVLAEIAAREAALQLVQREAKRQEEVRRQKEAILMQLHTVLTMRTKTLEQVDEESSVLKDHENLLAFFARKQVHLTDMLKQRMRELVDSIPKV